MTSGDLPDAAIYYQAWIKYFNFVKSSETKSKKPKYFFKNDVYKKQPSHSGNKDDQHGSFAIPTETSFFGIVYEDKLNILSSRETAFLRVIDSLSLDLIHDIPDDSHLKGGVRDLGKFSEGYCFEVITKEPVSGTFQMTEKETVPSKGSEKTWYICAEAEEVKTKLMNLIIQLRLKKQHKVGLWLKKNNPPKQQTISSIISPPSNEESGSKNSTDGYWILLQDWSSCSKKCGGGIQYQQLLCVPPKNGGKACKGEALRSKPCNHQPCPSVKEASEVLPKHGKENVAKPIIKLMPISSRPLRYDKCHLKEGDAIFTKNKAGVGIDNNPNKIPARVVMNDKTVSVYTDDTLATELGTFVIEKTTFKISEGKAHCFLLTSESIEGEFCNIDNNSKINFVDEWNYDFNLFKIQCRTERSVVNLNDKEEKELQDELQKKIDGAKLEVIKERTRKIQQKVQETPVNKAEKLQETAMLAMKKELAIDDLLQKEELEREDMETKALKQQLESEKKKDECLIKSIKEKELEDQYNLSRAQQDKEMSELREQAKQQILQKRKQVKMKIIQMRKRAERKKKILSNELQSLRSQVATQLNHVSKEGNMDLCFKPTNSEEDKKKLLKYCKNNFMDSSPVKFNECLAEPSFCYVCCESEFGDMHVKKRDQCYDKCDEVPKKGNEHSGSWQWVEPVN
eukprot:CAMPEP_0170516554 /NCGR_PEP_ID=MMETSP0209-20121228/2732_1 /TAXON_ID=665100 ORGANISM="Litonotus pictus, Strain P1" /NCGR_SAMPLE_ID=MMETSP0209 /ASSEMBLY_ACC=CAM_ASM_000301 /LENGTH=681 /DNA_ID=CAMNT_0010801479 /DNA_START=180 /DNA_END=2225 /DNA_ORIENTATION=-